MSTEREEFEAAMAREGYHSNPQFYRDGTYRDSEYAAGWAMWQAGRAAQAAAVKVPEGERWHAVLSPNGSEGVMFEDPLDAKYAATGDNSGRFGNRTIADRFRMTYDEQDTFRVVLVAAAAANTPTPGDKHE